MSEQRTDADVHTIVRLPRCTWCGSADTYAVSTHSDRAFKVVAVPSGWLAPQYRFCRHCEKRFGVYVEVEPPGGGGSEVQDDET